MQYKDKALHNHETTSDPAGGAGWGWGKEDLHVFQQTEGWTYHAYLSVRPKEAFLIKLQCCKILFALLCLHVKVTQGCRTAVSVRWCLLWHDFPGGKPVLKEEMLVLRFRCRRFFIWKQQGENSRSETVDTVEKMVLNWNVWSTPVA